MRIRSIVATVSLGVALATFGATGAASAAGPAIALSRLNGATTPLAFTLVVDTPGATSAKLVVDGVYVGEDTSAPLSFDVNVAAGTHRARVRPVVKGVEGRVDTQFAAVAGITSTTTTAPVAGRLTAPTPAPTTTPTAEPAPAVEPGAGIVVDSVAGIRSALATARPGDVIDLAPGEYTFKPRLVASASGTAAAPIVLRGPRDAVLRTRDASGDYGLHVTGDHWRVEGLTVAHGSKGIVLDGSVGTVIDGVEVFDIGAEGVHFRACSSDGVLQNSYVHDTGRTSPQYGEGVYVGSARSNWSQYQCTDAVERTAVGDNSERVVVEGNVFEDTTAEGADLKEGTDSGVLRRNTFRRSGTSGMNSADSAVDAKGNNWVIEDNVVTETNAPWDDAGVLRASEFADGFQTHSVYQGYGTRNVFRRNRVQGSIPGFGVGLYPMPANQVSCDNVAAGAASGLVGNNSKPAACTG